VNKRVDIRSGDPRNPQARALLAASHALMQSLFSVEDNHFLSVDDLCKPEVMFFVANIDGRAIGCAALALRDGYGEIKSMFVDPSARGSGVGAKLVAKLERTARRKNLPVLCLETGDKLTAALGLYQSCGFSVRGPFGDYVAGGTSVFMQKALG